MLDGSLPVVDYLIQIVTAPLDLSSAKGKSEAANTLLPLIRTMADSVQRAHYVQDLARRLRIDERTLLDMARNAEPAARGARGRPAVTAPAASKAVERLGLEDFCLAMLLRHPDELAAIEPLGLIADDFMQSENRQIFEALRTLEPDEGAGPAIDLRTRLNDALHPRHDVLVEHGRRYEPLIIEELEKSVLRLREQRLRQMIERLRFLEIEAQSAGDGGELQDYRQRIVMAAEQLQWTQAAIRARSMLGRAQSAANEKVV
jgi:DNA primase